MKKNYALAIFASIFLSILIFLLAVGFLNYRLKQTQDIARRSTADLSWESNLLKLTYNFTDRLHIIQMIIDNRGPDYFGKLTDKYEEHLKEINKAFRELNRFDSIEIEIQESIKQLLDLHSESSSFERIVLTWSMAPGLVVIKEARTRRQELTHRFNNLKQKLNRQLDTIHRKRLSTNIRYFTNSQIWTIVVGILGILGFILTLYLGFKNFKHEKIIFQSEAKYRSLFKLSADMMLLMDVDNYKIIDNNRAASRLLGYSADEFSKLQLTELYPPKQVEVFISNVRDLLEERKKVIKNIPFRKKDGTIFYTDITSAHIMIDNKELVMGVFRDITQRKEAEDQLKRSNERYRILYTLLEFSLQNAPLEKLLEQALEVIISFPSFKSKSKGAIFVVEDDPKELVLRTHRKLSEHIFEKCSKITFGSCLCGKAAESKEIQFANCVDHQHEITYEGIEHHGHYCVPIISEERVLGVLNVYIEQGHKQDKYEMNFLGAVSDTLAVIIGRKQIKKEQELLQAQLFQSAKLATVGTLASGVAHELNNPLVAVMGHAQLIERESNVSPKILERANMIYKASGRMQKIIDHLRTFSRQGKLEDWNNININNVINDSFILLRKDLVNSNIKINLSLSHDLPMVWGDPIRLESIFQNLITNSRDAFQDIKDDRQRKIAITTKVSRDKVIVNFSDNAGGMTEDTKNRIFDPFFTTKEVGKGTGLGMSICNNIITQHNGKMLLESELNKGTKYTLIFPLGYIKNNQIESNNSSNSECKIFNSVKVHKQKLKAHLSYFLTKPGKILIKLLFFQYIAPFRKNEVNSEFRSRISPIDHSNLT